jgi:hypothetical protein
MGNMSELARPVMMQHGIFDGIGIYGNLFDESGKRFWILDLVLESPQNSYSEPRQCSYWVCGGEFRTVRGARQLQGYPSTSTFLLDGVTHPPPAERQAALKAIGLWEKYLEETRQAGGQARRVSFLGGT